MVTQTQKLQTPKSFWVDGRLDGYSDWSFAFCREPVQNAIDAGATKIEFSIDDAPGRGSFGRPATLDQVVRVVIQDNGTGMDGRVLQDVFLSPGESTKKAGGFQGGFGTARNMLCFSQVRYSLRTQDQFVDGDGSEFVHTTIMQAAENRLVQADQAQAQGDLQRAVQLRAESAEITSGGNRVSGCRFEIDINPSETGYSWNNVDKSKLLSRLNEYLSMSQIACKVYVNGQEFTDKTLKGAVRRKLEAEMSDGTTQQFATVHTSQGERANFKGKLVVRASGAAMYSESVMVKDQVVVEIDPTMVRRVMTDNRDGMKSPYRESLQAFLRELASDNKSALESKDNRKHIKIQGGQGTIVVHSGAIPDIDIGAEGIVFSAGSVVPKEKKALYSSPETYQVQGYGGASSTAVNGLIAAIERGETTFLSRIAGDDSLAGQEIAAFESSVIEGSGPAALALLSPSTGAAVAATLASRQEQAGVAERQAETNSFHDMHDVHIQVDDLGDNAKLKDSVRRYSPAYWRRKGESLEGRGMSAHMLLAAWTSSCREAVESLLSVRPDLANQGKVEFATGFYFGQSSRVWTGTQYEKRHTYAEHQYRDGTNIALINPVLDDGKPAFDLGKHRRESPDDLVGGIQDIDAYAMHEVAHFFENVHNEDYAYILTKLVTVFNSARAHQRMRDTVDAVRQAYGRGKTRVQSMDTPADIVVLEAQEDVAETRRREPRPCQVVLAHSAPVTTIVSGALSAPENKDLNAPFLRGVLNTVSRQVADGVAQIDCETLQKMETDLSLLADTGWNLDSIDLPPLDEITQIPDRLVEQPMGPEADAIGTETGGFDLDSIESPPLAELVALDTIDQIDDAIGTETGGFDLDSIESPPLAELVALDTIDQISPDQNLDFDFSDIPLPPSSELEELEVISSRIPVIEANPTQPMPVQGLSPKDSKKSLRETSPVKNQDRPLDKSRIEVGPTSQQPSAQKRQEPIAVPTPTPVVGTITDQAILAALSALSALSKGMDPQTPIAEPSYDVDSIPDDEFYAKSKGKVAKGKSVPLLDADFDMDDIMGSGEPDTLGYGR